MDWTSLFEMLKQVFANDPTMILLLTVGFFFLKMIWPTPEPASQQILKGYADRIRQALQTGNEAGARQLAEAGVDKAKAALVAEAEPKVGGFLDVIMGLFGSGTFMPILLIGGVVLLLMLTQGGGCKKTTAAEPAQTLSWRATGEQDRFVELDAAAGTVGAVGAPIVFCAGEPAWSWADGITADAGAVDRGGFFEADAGAGGAADLAGVPPVGGGVVCAAADCRCCGSDVRRPAVRVARPLARLRGSGWYPGKRILRAAGLAARAVGRLRLPGRPFARLLGRR